MEDQKIVELYWQRDEMAIRATDEKYGHYCYEIAYRILRRSEDADESVNDTYMAAWEAIPPHRPAVLATFLGKLTRRISLNRWRDENRQRRGGGEVPLALEELGECVAGRDSIEDGLQLRELSRAISRFLSGLSKTQRDVFVCRYWFLAEIEQIAGRFGFSESKVKSMLLRTRKKLRIFLSEEGFL